MRRLPFAVTRLDLTHFRSHARARLMFDPRPVAIWGPNGAGKTNILEALSLLSPGRGLRRAATDEMIHRPDGPGWVVEAEVETPAQTHEIRTSAEPGGARQVLIDGKAAPQLALGRVLRMLWLVPSMDRLWLEGADGRRRFLDRIALSFEPSHAEASLAYEKAMRERNRLLRDMVQDTHWYLALEARMAEAAAAITLNRRTALARIAAASEGAATAFPIASLTLEGDEAFPHGELAAALAESRRRDMAAGRTLLGPHRADLGAIWSTKGIPAAQCSTGEQKALLISLILANARALAGDIGAAPIVLLDEVAAHLDAGRRADLYVEISELGAQAFMTGTGPELFADLGPRAQRLEVTESRGHSQVRVA